jgi:DnaJ-class molecular chaperone
MVWTVRRIWGAWSFGIISICMDYYNILGVSKTSTQEEIKKSYKKLAMQHHPDHGGDTTKFAEINEAYETLKDPTKRQAYDTPQARTNFDQSGFDDVFSNFFKQNVQRRNRDVRITISVTLEEVLSGKDIIASFILLTGQQTTANIRVQPGVEHGETIRYKGLGDNTVRQLPRGDLLVQVIVVRHKIFERNNKHLYMDHGVTIFDLVLGTKIAVKTLSGSSISVNIPEGTQPGTTLSVAGHGLPHRVTGQTGNLYVMLKARIPTTLTEDMKKRIKEINDELSNSA